MHLTVEAGGEEFVPNVPRTNASVGPMNTQLYQAESHSLLMTHITERKPVQDSHIN